MIREKRRPLNSVNKIASNKAAAVPTTINRKFKTNRIEGHLPGAIGQEEEFEVIQADKRRLPNPQLVVELLEGDQDVRQRQVAENKRIENGGQSERVSDVISSYFPDWTLKVTPVHT
ncbi:hypothetical protein [Cohnella xylanilytica]|uniref:hypothetical protein n=1 Tax=Cohnella xylanilytica TaxID=557555 RepID=UPI0021A9CDFA|nr:hypothetical protein [Cohnella xylanilytica]